MFTIDELVRLTRGQLRGSAGNRRVCGISIDSRTIKPGEAFIAFKGEHFDGHDFIDAALARGASCIVCANGRSRRTGRAAAIEVGDPVRALGDIARGYRMRFPVPVIAITGSCGKTTTKEMLAWLLARRFSVHKTEGTRNNQIGLPMTLLGLARGHDVAVVELGTNHFGEIAYLADVARPTVGIITNIGAAHLEHFGTEAGVLREKYALIRRLMHPALAVLNADDPLLAAKAAKLLSGRLAVTFARQAQADFKAGRLAYERGGLRFTLNGRHHVRLRTLGAENVSNALAAISCCRILGMGYADIIGRLSTFRFPHARLECKKLKQRRVIDDTYNANPVSLRQALEALKNIRTAGKKILVMGDMLELGARAQQIHYQLGKEAVGVCDKLIAVGKLARCAMQAARDMGVDTRNLFYCDSSEEARRLLFAEVSRSSRDVILVKGSRMMRMEKIVEPFSVSK